MTKPRITEKKLKRAAALAKEKGVRVRIGDFTFEPANEDSPEELDAERREALMDETMGSAKR